MTADDAGGPAAVRALVALAGDLVHQAVAALGGALRVDVHTRGTPVLAGVSALITDPATLGDPASGLVTAIRSAGDAAPAVVLVGGRGDEGVVHGLPRPVDDVVDRHHLPRTLLARVRRAVDLRAEAEAAHRRARAAEDRAAGLMQALQDGLAVVGADGALTEVNDRLCRMTGLDRAELIGAREPLPFWSPDQVPAIEALVEEVARGRVTGEIEVMLRRRDGRRIPVSVTSSPLHDAAGAPMGRVTTIRDITARRAIEDEQESLRRIAMRVAAGATPERVFSLVARETADLFHCDSGMVVTFGDGLATVVGAHGDHSAGEETFPTTGDGVLARVARERRPAWIRDYAELDAASPLRAHAIRLGYRASAAAPVVVDGALWGAVLVTTREANRLDGHAGARLGRFAELVALAVDNAQTHAELRRLATTDPLTHLANRRAFEERLPQEAARARRHGRRLSLVVVDLDHFKRVNDEHGHPAGDRVLAEFAERLRGNVRPEDFVARMGGEEFAWLMPECGAPEAASAAERLRGLVARAPFPEGITVTLCAGVCELSDADGPGDLYRRADEALYRAKADGRNRVRRYPPAAEGDDGLPPDGARPVERLHTPRAVRALARAVDARDPSTRRHSERVAQLAVRIAGVCGWPARRVAALGEAALVHDVGKIGVRDAVLLADGPLTDADRAEIACHPDLGAQIAEEVMSAEQVAWIRHHHERWDGAGYPRGLAGPRIPDGALIIAVADAFDTMCAARPYAAARTASDALAECRRERGRQFAPWAVDALDRLAAADGDLREAAAVRV